MIKNVNIYLDQQDQLAFKKRKLKKETKEEKPKKKKKKNVTSDSVDGEVGEKVVKKKKMKKLLKAEEANTETAINNKLMDTALLEDTTLGKENNIAEPVSIEQSVKENGEETTDEIIENIELNTDKDTVVQTLNFDEAVEHKTNTGLENDAPKSAKKKKKRTRKSLMKAAESDTTSAEEDTNNKAVESTNQVTLDEVPTTVEEKTQNETLNSDSMSGVAGKFTQMLLVSQLNDSVQRTLKFGYVSLSLSVSLCFPGNQWDSIF